MAEVTPTLNRLHGAQVVTYSGLSAGDTLQPYAPPTGYTLDSIQVESDNLDGESVSVTGSTDGTNFRAILAADISAPGLASPTTQARRYSGEVSDGGGSPDPITITFFFQATT